MASPDLELVTIPFSHYCDKARWALERAKLPFVERAYLPALHWLPSRLAGGGRTVPVLRTPDGVRADSTDILHYIDGRVPEALRLFPSGDPAVRIQVDRWEERFDEQLGPASRRWAYGLFLPERQWTLGVLGKTFSPAQRVLLRVGFPLIAQAIRRSLKVNPAGVARSEKKLREIFAEVADTLSDGRAYLAGDRFTAADLTFAALAAPVVFPDGYERFMARFDEIPSPIAPKIREWRETPAGAFALRMFREHRDAVAR